MKKWKDLAATWDSRSPLYYANGSLSSDANTLVMKTTDASFPPMPTDISMISTWGRDVLLFSADGSVIPLGEFLQVVVIFIPHTSYVSGTHNIMYHKGIICSFT